MRALAAADRADEVPVFSREFTARLFDEIAEQPSEEFVQAARDATVGRRSSGRAVRKPSPPRDTPYFTGREEILEQLDELMTAEGSKVDVVALNGPPGIGKTALVKHWARRRADRFPDGVLYVDLAGYSETPLVEPHAVMALFLSELGVVPNQIPNTTSDRAALLRHLLSMRAVLVFLDNARDSAHVRPLLEATSPCPALITSRQRLTGVTYRDGVQLLSVPALPPDEATNLLASRIGRDVPDHRVSYARLVDLCQGLPLALRVVSEHIAMRPAVPIEELADELRQAKRLLDAGSHGDDNSTTLRSTFSLSYRALRPEHRRLFRLLGLHPGTRFSVDAVSALANGSFEDVERSLDALVGAHLVDPEGMGYYVIHDLLHMYATDTVREDEPAEQCGRAVRRMFDWYLQAAHDARTHVLGDDQEVPALEPVEPVGRIEFTSPDEAYRWLVTERANLVACTYRASVLSYHQHVWRLAACLNVLNRHEDPRDLLDIHELGRRSAEIAGNTAAVGGCLNNKGAIYARLNDKTNAAECFALAREAFTKAGDEYGLAVFTHNTGFVRLQMGLPAEAIAWFTRALGMHSRGSSDRGVAKSHRCLGDAWRMLDRRREARSHYQQSLYYSKRVNDVVGQAKSLSRLATLSAEEGQFEQAISCGEEALEMFRCTHVDRDGVASTLYLLATVHLRLGAHSTAVRVAQESVRRYHETGNLSGHIDGLTLLGQAHAASGEPVKAVHTWMVALRITPSADPRVAALRRLLDEDTPLTVPNPCTGNSEWPEHFAREEQRRSGNEVPEGVE
jgi:tetratricopeptide (TPR) repeat protein